MSNKNIKKILVLTVILCVILNSFPSLAFSAKGIDGKEITNINDFSDTEGSVGTKTNPICRVDGTGAEFEDWAGDKYFTDGCEFKNLTVSDESEYVLNPVYDSEAYDVTLDASGGKIEGKDTVTFQAVNFDDKTITDGELLEKDEEKDLAELLSNIDDLNLNGYYPYFVGFDDSEINKRLFFNGSDKPDEKENTDCEISEAVYDCRKKCTLYVVWKDNERAEAWSDAQKAAGEFIAYIDGYSNINAYNEKFGGSDSLNYGCFEAEKLLKGAKNLSYEWTLKSGDIIKDGDQKTSKFSKTNMNKDYDGCILSEVIQYGPEDHKYTMNVDTIQFKVYGRPAVTSAVIE